MEGMDVLIDYDHLVVRPRASLILIHKRHSVTIYCRALLKIEIRHFDGPAFQYTLRAPCQCTSFS